MINSFGSVTQAWEFSTHIGLLKGIPSFENSTPLAQMATIKLGRTNESPQRVELNRISNILEHSVASERNFALYHYSDRVINHLWVWSSLVNKQCLKNNLMAL